MSAEAGSATSEDPAKEPRLIETTESFEKSKRNSLFWASALTLLMFAQNGQPVSASVLGSGSNLSLAPKYLGAILLITLCYHLFAFWKSTSIVWRRHRADGVGPNERARLERRAAEIDRLVEKRNAKSDTLRLTVLEILNSITNHQRELIDEREALKADRVRIQQILRGNMTVEGKLTHPVHFDDHERSFLSDMVERWDAIQDTTRYDLAREKFGEYHGSANDYEQENLNLQQLLKRYYDELRAVDEAFLIGDRRFLSFYDIGVTWMFSVFAGFLFLLYLVTGSPLQAML